MNRLPTLLFTLLIAASAGARLDAVAPVPGQSSTVVLSLQHDGIERSYRLHTPAAVQSGSEVALVIDLHGGSRSGREVETMTGLSDLADRDGFVVAYPDAIEGHWNDGRGHDAFPSQRDDVDDVGFLVRLIDVLAARLPIDASRVFMLGASNGGMMTFRFACERPTKIAAAAAVIAGLPARLRAQCTPERGTRMLMIAGTDDPLMPWDGGAVTVVRQSRGEVLAIEETARFWARQRSCNEQATIEQLADTAPDDGCRVTRLSYEGCESAADNVLYRIDGGGHRWPGAAQRRAPRLLDRLLGRQTDDIDASEVIVRFFGLP